MTLIQTDCGHDFSTNKYLLSELQGVTTDCPTCGRELMILPEPILKAQGLHEYMHERNPAWPADGANTGFIEV